MFGRASRIVCGAASAVFVLFAILQLNDPDPVQWAAIYGAAAVACFVAALRGRVDFRFPAAVGAFALIWTALILPQAWGSKSFIDNMRLGEGMRDPTTEVSREIGGLLVIVAVMVPLSIAAYRARPFRNRVPSL